MASWKTAGLPQCPARATYSQSLPFDNRCPGPNICSTPEILDESIVSPRACGALRYPTIPLNRLCCRRAASKASSGAGPLPTAIPSSEKMYLSCWMWLGLLSSTLVLGDDGCGGGSRRTFPRLIRFSLRLKHGLSPEQA